MFEKLTVVSIGCPIISHQNLSSRSPGQGRDPRSSPAYHPPGSQSPDVIDIDLEEMEPPTDEVVEDGGEEDVSRDLEDPEQVVVNMAEDHHDDQEEVEVAQPEEGVSSEI